ncbi:C40 family peptidase [Sphingomonas sp. ID0503]|uniref:C40 family peptidase n=1 Tax=Sphingomonas sp. ID0503 TaxID=3399691 RepID=UPI003AFA669F
MATSLAPPASPQRPRTPTTERFRLTGPSVTFDPRVNAARKDIADVALAGCLFAPHYVRPQVMASRAPAEPIRAAASSTATATSELLLGEDFAVLEMAGGWAWGYSAHDHYVGYIREDALGSFTMPNHRVSARSALLFSKPDIKSPVTACWPIGARFAGEAEGAFIATDTGYVHARHAEPLDRHSDPVKVAARLMGAPYLWGGRGGGGVDCSGLVQLALSFAGVEVQRDSDQQRASIGVEIDRDAPLRRGDIVFFPGHVGLMTDESTLLHANAHWMAVVAEPLADVVARLATYPEPILAVRRLEN